MQGKFLVINVGDMTIPDARVLEEIVKKYTDDYEEVDSDFRPFSMPTGVDDAIRDMREGKAFSNLYVSERQLVDDFLADCSNNEL